MLKFFDSKRIYSSSSLNCAVWNIVFLSQTKPGRGKLFIQCPRTPSAWPAFFGPYIFWSPHYVYFKPHWDTRNSAMSHGNRARHSFYYYATAEKERIQAYGSQFIPMWNVASRSDFQYARPLIPAFLQHFITFYLCNKRLVIIAHGLISETWGSLTRTFGRPITSARSNLSTCKRRGDPVCPA